MLLLLEEEEEERGQNYIIGKVILVLGEGNRSSQKQGITQQEIYEEELAILGRNKGEYQIKDEIKERGQKYIFLTYYKNNS